jgi:hypothetical protein
MSKALWIFCFPFIVLAAHERRRRARRLRANRRWVAEVRRVPTVAEAEARRRTR